MKVILILTIDQWHTLRQIFKDARELGLSIYIEKYYPQKRSVCFFDKDSFANWLAERVNWCVY